jgi:hypothetical protein
LKKILLPGSHPVGLKITNMSTWVPSIHGWLHNRALIKNNKLVLNFLLNLTAIFFVLKFVKKKLSKSEIIFTTFCPFSFRAIQLLSLFDVKIYIRLTNTAERRGILSEKIQLDRFKQNKNIRIGYETEAIRNNLFEKEFLNIYDSKFPSQNQTDNNYLSTKPITISFLGYPTRNKGRSNILPIISQVAEVRPELKWIVQLGENDPIHDSLNKLNIDIQFVYGKISQELMIESLEKTSVLCLPYNPEAFKYNSSSMMYEAADYLVPVIAFSGSAFAYDIEQFGCGLTAVNQGDLIRYILELNIDSLNSLKLGCVRFNQHRNRSNLEFLRLLEGYEN